MQQATYANWIMVGLGIMLTYVQVAGYLAST
jgi:hypothetical protein